MALSTLGGTGSIGGGYGGTGFSAYPTPMTGQGAFGKVPGPINLPPSLYAQANTALPGLAGNAATASSDVQSLLQGQVSPDTADYIRNLTAAKGVSSGVAGTPFNTADLVKSLGLTSEQLVTSGLGAYNQLLQTVGGLQENPSLMADIGQSNAALGAAPDPSAVHAQMLRDLENEFNMGNFYRNPAGGTHILGPAPTFGGGPGVGGGLSASDLNTPTSVGGYTGPQDTSLTSSNLSWNDYLRNTFGTSSPAGIGNSLYGGTDYSQSENAPGSYGSQFSDASLNDWLNTFGYGTDSTGADLTGG